MGTVRIGFALNFDCVRTNQAIGKAILNAGAGVVLFPQEDLSNQISDAALKLADKQVA